jgi:hypothetical protein
MIHVRVHSHGVKSRCGMPRDVEDPPRDEVGEIVEVTGFW